MNNPDDHWEDALKSDSDRLDDDEFEYLTPDDDDYWVSVCCRPGD